VDQTTLCGFYALAGCLVLPSHAETWGLVVNEALACGLPVLVSRQCGCAETLVKPGTNGWIFDSRDADGLAALMGRIASLSDKERAAMSGASRAMVSDWGLERFAQGAWEAVQMCRNVTRGFASPIDRAVLRLWKGRYRP
jgi:glycosyltransferase involved in cell wall biosynthesis